MQFAKGLCLASLVLCGAAWGQSADPARMNIGKLAESGYSNLEMFRYAYEIVGEESAAEKAGLHKLPRDKPGANIYESKQPVTSFGLQTKQVAFSGAFETTLVLDTPSAEEFAKKHGLVKNDKEDFGTRYWKVLRTEKRNSPRLGTVKNAIALIAMERPDHPGKTFVGCDYDFKLDE